MIIFLRQFFAFILFIVALIVAIAVFAITIPLFRLLQCLEMALDFLIEVIFVSFGGIYEIEEFDNYGNFPAIFEKEELDENAQHIQVNSDNTSE